MAPPDVTTTVGGSLRLAREAAGLSVIDVAQSLKFSPKQVELLEAGNYAALPGHTIVRGFTRSYARLLGLDADALVSLLEGSNPNAVAEIRPPDNMGIAGDGRRSNQLSPIAAVATVIALAAVLLGLWHFFGPKQPIPSLGNLVAESPLTSAMPAQEIVQPLVHPPAQTASASGPQTLPLAGETSVPSPLPASQNMSSQSVPAEATLHFVFGGRSWVEVSDATNQKIYSGENLSGSQLSLAGKPPFDLVVGNAAKVKLSLGDRVIDLAPYTRAEVARLKVE
jgi:cytoskeleton protein RodZ